MWFVNLLMAALFFGIGFFSMAMCTAKVIVETSEDELLEKIRELKKSN